VKKIFVIILISIFIFNLAGYWGVFFSMKFRIKKEIRSLINSKIPENKLCEIIISLKSYNSKTSEITWIEKNKEFLYKNCMYDIVTSKIKNDNIYFYCINDKKESELFASLYQFVEKNITDNFNHNKNLQFLLQKLFNSCYLGNFYNEMCMSFFIHKITFDSEKYFSFIPEKLFPPPKFNS
jgi:hypothetical protein